METGSVNYLQWAGKLPNMDIDWDVTSIDTINKCNVSPIKNSAYNINKTKGTFNSKYNKSWWDTTCSRYVAKRRQARRLFLAHPTDVNKLSWRNWENTTKNYILYCKQEAWKKFVGSINSNVNNK